MLAASPFGLRLTKQGLDQELAAGSLDAAVALGDRQQILCAQTGAMREAVDAFFARRAPEWAQEPEVPETLPILS